MKKNPSGPVFMSISRHNTVEAVGGQWVEAAAIGGAADSLAPNKVVGQPIECYLKGSVTQMYYDALFQLCRLRNEVIVRKYRCDSPTHQRFLQMTLTPKNDGGIDILHEVLKEVPFENRVTVVDDGDGPGRALSLYSSRCSICNRLQFPGDSAWLPPEDLSRQAPLVAKVIHTICPDCSEINWI